MTFSWPFFYTVNKKPAANHLGKITRPSEARNRNVKMSDRMRNGSFKLLENRYEQ